MTDDPRNDAAHHEPGKPGAAVASHDDSIDLPFLRLGDNIPVRFITQVKDDLALDTLPGSPGFYPLKIFSHFLFDLVRGLRIPEFDLGIYLDYQQNI